MFQNHYGIYAIAFLCFLLMLQNVFLVEEWRQGGGASYTHTYVNCGYEKIIARELQRWKKTDIFKVYTPKRSCFVCSKPRCVITCNKWVNESRMTIYNNLFEFGLFAFNMAQKNIFRIIINNMCHFKVEILPNQTVDRETEIYFFECLTDVLNADEKCTEKLVKKPPKNFNISNDCIFVALAFIRRKKLHYSVSFNCTVIPSLLLNENISIDITSNKCFIDKETKNQTAAFEYKDSDSDLPYGIAIMLPCTTGGYAFDDQTGHIITGETCELFLKDETNLRGLSFLVKEFYNDDKSFLVESRPSTWDEIMSRDPNKKYVPTYMNPEDEWIKQVEITKIIKENPPSIIKERKGCKLVERKKTTTPPTTTADIKDPTGNVKDRTDRPFVPFDSGKGDLLKEGSYDGNRGIYITNKSTTTEKPKISGMGGASDASRGSLHFLSIKMKLIMFASNLGIIYHL